MSEAVSDQSDKRRFRGVGELERTGYIPAGSAAEREAGAAEEVKRRPPFWCSHCGSLCRTGKCARCGKSHPVQP